MISSMTACAREEESGEAGSVTCEIRSWNSRNLDMVLRIPPGFSGLEESLKAMASGRLSRGRVEIHLQIQAAPGTGSGAVVDETIADTVYRALDDLARRYNLEERPTLTQIAGFPGVIRPADPGADREQIRPLVETVVERGLESLGEMRKREGEHLARDLGARLQTIREQIRQIGIESDGMPERYRQKLDERICKLIDNPADLDPSRLAQEVAYLADKSDISEELVRMDAHIRQFADLMDAPEPAGRKLNFLLQEMLRETNTIGSKTEVIRVSHRVVEIKSELEKMREQVQNIE